MIRLVLSSAESAEIGGMDGCWLERPDWERKERTGLLIAGLSLSEDSVYERKSHFCDTPTLRKPYKPVRPSNTSSPQNGNVGTVTTESPPLNWK